MMWVFFIVVTLLSFIWSSEALVGHDRLRGLFHVSTALGIDSVGHVINVGDAVNFAWAHAANSGEQQPYAACVHFTSHKTIRQALQALNIEYHQIYAQGSKDMYCVRAVLSLGEYQSLSRDPSLQFTAVEPVPVLAKFDPSFTIAHLHHLMPSHAQSWTAHPILTTIESARQIGLSLVLHPTVNPAQQTDIIHTWRSKAARFVFSSMKVIRNALDLTQHRLDSTESTPQSRSKPESSSDLFVKLPKTLGKRRFSGQSSHPPQYDSLWSLETVLNHVHKQHSEVLTQFVGQSLDSLCHSLSHLVIQPMRRGAYLPLPPQLLSYALSDAGEADRVRFALCLSVTARLFAEDDRVEKLSLAPPLQLQNNFARQILQTGNHNGHEPYSDIGLNGTGVILGVSDTGIDEKSCFFNDPVHGQVRRSSPSHPFTDLRYRKVVQYVNYSGSSGDYANGHGSHVAGTLAGFCVNPQYAASVNVYRGMASAAQLAFFDIGANNPQMDLYVPYDIGEDILQPAHTAGARIHSNSWGGGYFYDAFAWSVDAYVSANPDMSVFFAVGNNGVGGMYTALSPGVAKNVIAVGAVETGHSSGQSVDSIAYFSSLGPTLDGRIKPDVLSPGLSLYSTHARAEDSQQSSCDVEAKAGTSMATPAMAGTAGLIQQYFVTQRKKFWSKYCNPAVPTCDADSTQTAPQSLSAALMKAFVLHGAEAVQKYNGRGTNLGVVSLGRTPDFFQGYGRFQLSNLLVITPYQPCAVSSE